MRTAAERQAEAARYQQISEQASPKQQISAAMTKEIQQLRAAEKRAAIESIVEKLEEVDAMIQETLGACDLCYAMHNDITGMIDELEDEA